MGRFPIAVLLCATLALPSAATTAQRATIPAGTRVRVVFPPGGSGEERATRQERRVIGQLLGADDTSLVLMAGHRNSTEYRLPVHGTLRLDVSDGRAGSHAGRGALVGLLVGGVIGFTFGAMAETECECPLVLGGVSSAAFGVGGLLIGAGIGWTIPRDRWRPVPLPVRVEPRATR